MAGPEPSQRHGGPCKPAPPRGTTVQPKQPRPAGLRRASEATRAEGGKKGPGASKGAALIAARSGAEQSRGRVRHGRARGPAARGGGGLAGTRAGLC